MKKLRCLKIRILEAGDFYAASTASASTSKIVFLLVAIPPSKLEATNRFQFPAKNAVELFFRVYQTLCEKPHLSLWSDL